MASTGDPEGTATGRGTGISSPKSVLFRVTAITKPGNRLVLRYKTSEAATAAAGAGEGGAGGAGSAGASADAGAGACQSEGEVILKREPNSTWWQTERLRLPAGARVTYHYSICSADGQGAVESIPLSYQVPCDGQAQLTVDDGLFTPSEKPKSKSKPQPLALAVAAPAPAPAVPAPEQGQGQGQGQWQAHLAAMERRLTERLEAELEEQLSQLLSYVRRGEQASLAATEELQDELSQQRLASSSQQASLAGLEHELRRLEAEVLELRASLREAHGQAETQLTGLRRCLDEQQREARGQARALERLSRERATLQAEMERLRVETTTRSKAVDVALEAQQAGLEACQAGQACWACQGEGLGEQAQVLREEVGAGQRALALRMGRAEDHLGQLQEQLQRARQDGSATAAQLSSLQQHSEHEARQLSGISVELRRLQEAAGPSERLRTLEQRHNQEIRSLWVELNEVRDQLLATREDSQVAARLAERLANLERQLNISQRDIADLHDQVATRTLQQLEDDVPSRGAAAATAAAAADSQWQDGREAKTLERLEAEVPGEAAAATAVDSQWQLA